MLLNKIKLKTVYRRSMMCIDLCNFGERGEMLGVGVGELQRSVMFSIASPEDLRT